MGKRIKFPKPNRKYGPKDLPSGSKPLKQPKATKPRMFRGRRGK